MKKTTQDLLNLMKSSRDYDSYRQQTQGELGDTCMKVDRALNALLLEKNLVKAEVIARSGIEVHYTYQILQGVKTPTRDKMIMFCIGMGLSIEEAQKLLRITGFAQLYAKEERDNVILFGMTKKLSIIDLNDLLYEMHYRLLT